LTKELKTASNIKDRTNRKCVERVLKMLIEKIKLLPSSSPFGFCFLAGIDDQDKELMSVIPLELPVKRFIYSCGSKFRLDDLPLGRKANQSSIQGLVVLMSGDQAQFYQACGEALLPKGKTDANLVKRQKKGGQSAVRFSRLAEESRHGFIVRCVDALVVLQANQKLPLWIYGAHELSTDLMVALKKTKGPKAAIEFVPATWTDLNAWISKERKHIVDRINTSKGDRKEELTVDQTMDALQRNSDRFCFGPKEVKANEKDLELIIACSTSMESKQEKLSSIIVLDKHSPHYGTVQKFGGMIGLRYFAATLQEETEETDDTENV
jgi:hypothetical protein